MKKSGSARKGADLRSPKKNEAPVKNRRQPEKSGSGKLARKESSLRRPLALLGPPSGEGELRPVAFHYFNDTAGTVYLAGSFNDWQPRVTPMSKRPGDLWTTEVLLKPGDHEYRLIVDDRWEDDPLAPRFVANAFGGLNAFRRVEPWGAPLAAPV